MRKAADISLGVRKTVSSTVFRFAPYQSLPLMREVDFAKQKTEGEKTVLSPSHVAILHDSPLVRGGLGRSRDGT